MSGVDAGRLVGWACDAVSIPSFTGEEQTMAEWIAGELDAVVTGKDGTEFSAARRNSGRFSMRL